MPNYDMGTAHGRIRIDYEGDAPQRAAHDMRSASDSAKESDKGFIEFGKTLATLVTTMAAVGPAAAAMGAAVVAAGGLVAASFVSAGAALGAFGLAAKGQAKNLEDTMKAAEKLSDAQKDAASKKALADRLSASGDKFAKKAQQEATTAKFAAIKAQQEYNAQVAGLPKETVATANAFIELKSAFQEWSDSLAPDVMPIFTRALKLLTRQLPLLTPLVKVAAKALSDMLGDIEKGASGGGIATFISTLTNLARTTLPAFLRSIKNVGIGLFGIFSAFLPESDKAAGNIEALTKKFADFGKGLGQTEGFKNFMDNMKTSGPILLKVLGDLATTVVNLAKAFAPFAGTSLLLTRALAELTANTPVPVLKVLVALLIVTRISMTLYAAATTLAALKMRLFGTAANPGILSKFAAAVRSATLALGRFIAACGRAIAAMARMIASAARATLSFAAMVIRIIAVKVAMVAVRVATLLWAAAIRVASLAMSLSPFGLIVLAIIALVVAFVLLWKNSETFRRIVIGVFNAVRTAITTAVSFIIDFVRNHWQLLLAIMLGPFGIILGLIIKNFGAIKDFIVGAVNGILSFIGDHWHLIITIMTGPLGFMVGLIIKNFGAIRSFIGNVLKFIGGLFVKFWSNSIATFNRISRVVTIIANIFNSVNRAVGSRLQALVNAVARIPGMIFRIFSGAGNWLWNAGRNIMSGLINGIASMFGRLRDWLSSVTNLIPSWKGPAKRDAALLTKNGQLIMQSLIDGFVSKLPQIQASLGDISQRISSSPALTNISNTAFSQVAAPNVPAVAGAVPTPLTTDQIRRAFMDALTDAGVGKVYLDGRLITSVVSKNTGRVTAQRRRTG